MANATEDNGKQIITFRYQQPGTAETFNKIIHGVLPRGVISGGELVKSTDTKVLINEMQLLIGDNDVTVHVETTEDAEVTVSTNAPYIVATYSWINIVTSYVNFQNMNLSEISQTDNIIILGRCVFNGSTLEGFDYTRKTWCASHYQNDFGWKNLYKTHSPSFNVIPKENPENNEFVLLIEGGKGIINGQSVSFTGVKTLTLQINDSTQEDYFQKVIQTNCQRNDIVVLIPDGNGSGTPKYIMGEETSLNDPADFPLCPSDGLVIAKLNWTAGTYNSFSGANVEYVYNSNYYGGSPTIGKKQGTTTINQHTLYL